MSFKLQMELVDADEDYFSSFFRGAASRPCGPPALWSGAPFPGRGRPSDGG